MNGKHQHKNWHMHGTECKWIETTAASRWLNYSTHWPREEPDSAQLLHTIDSPINGINSKITKTRLPLEDIIIIVTVTRNRHTCRQLQSADPAMPALRGLQFSTGRTGCLSSFAAFAKHGKKWINLWWSKNYLRNEAKDNPGMNKIRSAEREGVWHEVWQDSWQDH